MRISDEQSLENWEQRSQELATEHATRQARIKDNMRRIRKRLSARERKRETQRLIVRGRFHEHLLKRLASNSPDCPAASPQFRAWLDAAFDAFVTRADHRELFGLPLLEKPGETRTTPIPPTSPGSRDNPLLGFRPLKLGVRDWGSQYQGDTAKLPANLVGLWITVTDRQDNSWTARITEVISRGAKLLKVRDSGRPAEPPVLPS